MVTEVDQTVIRDMLGGDTKAFQLVLDRHIGPLSHYVGRMMNHTAEAEDIVQETFVRFWTTRDRYDPNRVKLTTWLHRIAHNLCIDSFRKSKTRDKYAASFEEDESQSLEAEHDSHSTVDEVRAALMQLSESHRSAIVLCHYQGLTNREAAEILDVTTDALESTLRRARKKLREMLDGP